MLYGKLFQRKKKWDWDVSFSFQKPCRHFIPKRLGTGTLQVLNADVPRTKSRCLIIQFHALFIVADKIGADFCANEMNSSWHVKLICSHAHSRTADSNHIHQ
jgi:hypothetical protein